MFGVIICPRCDRARGVDLSVKTSKCPSCGLHVDVPRMKTCFQTENESELAEAVRSVSVRMQRSIEDYDDGVILARQAVDDQCKKAKSASFDVDSIGMIARDLSANGDFGIDELASVLLSNGIDIDAAKVIQIMLDNGIVYEPRAGRFKSL